MPDLSTPEGVSRALISYLEDGHIDAVMDLYEAGAVFVDLTGMMRGDGIRAAHRDFIDKGNRLLLKESVAYVAGEIALVHWQWEVVLGDGSSIAGASAEVLRRQPNGDWKFVIDNSDGVDVLGESGPTTGA